MQTTISQFLHDVALQVTLGSQYQPAMALPVPLEQFLQALGPGEQPEKEQTTLQLLTALELYRRAGYQPAALSSPLQLQATCEAVPVAFIPPALQQMFRQMQEARFTGLPLLLWKQWLQVNAGIQASVPYALIPSFLTVFAALPELQPLAFRLLNVRARWLATRQAVWQWATVPVEIDVQPIVAVADADTQKDVVPATQQCWTGASDKVQLLFFRVLRQHQPVQARIFLQQQWLQLAAEQREKLLELLATGLEPSDSDFLQQVLAEDRSAYVRQQALLLQASLPQSTACQGLQQLFTQCVSLDATGQLQLQLNAALWQQCQPFGIDNKAISIYLRQSSFRRSGLGQQGLSIHLLCSLFPLACWQAVYADIAQCLAAIEKSIWREAMLLGVMHASINQKNQAWADALITHASAFLLQAECMYEQGELMKLASPALRDSLVLAQVDAFASSYSFEQIQKSWDSAFSSLSQRVDAQLLSDEMASVLLLRSEKQNIRYNNGLYIKELLSLVAAPAWLQQHVTQFEGEQLGLLNLRTSLIAQAGHSA